MRLIEVYIQEVIRRLPSKSREDIGLELRSTIEDTLPDDYNESDVKEVLGKLGSPAALASGYRDKPMHLIGPRYYDLYVSLLKMILPITAVIALISLIAEYVIGFRGEEVNTQVVLTALGGGVWGMIEAGIHFFFWITLVFVIIERTDKRKDQDPLSQSMEKWTPDDLKNITYIPEKKAITKLGVFGYLMWTAIWATLYFYANDIIGFFNDGNDFVPALNQEVLRLYWPIVLVVVALDLTLALYQLFKGQWTKKMAMFNTTLEFISATVFIVILSNPNLLNQAYLTFMSRVFDKTALQFQTSIVVGGIALLLFSAAYSIFSGFRKARIIETN